MFKSIVATALTFWAGVAFAGDKPQFVPPAAWVKVAPDPQPKAADIGPAIQILLSDDQAYLAKDGDHFYDRRVVKILTPDGLSALGTAHWTWDPATEDAQIHALKIIRDGKIINVLGDGHSVAVLRRETNLERAMLDGRLTATLQMEGLQVGDIVDSSWTLTRHDPALKGHSQFADVLGQLKVGHLRMRVLWDADKPIRWTTTPGLEQPKVARSGGRKELVIDMTDAKAPPAPVRAPARFARLGTFEVTQFSNWADVATLMTPLFDQAATLSTASPLHQEVARIAAQSTDARTRAALALKLVQDQIRYQLVALNDGGLVPAGADETWTRRFGDCKGKTALLLSLLHALSIDADPVLVNSRLGDGMDERLPMVGHFDHVLVRAMIAGKAYWLDGTRASDKRGLDAIEPPPFRWGLVLHEGEGRLLKIDQPPLTEPSAIFDLKYDASRGFDKKAPARLEMDYRGEAAAAMWQALAQRSREDNEHGFQQLASVQFPQIAFKSVDWTFDDNTDLLRVTLTGDATLDWRRNADVNARELLLGGSEGPPKGLPWREPGPNRDAPYAAPYPLYTQSRVAIVLPDHGAGFTLTGSDVRANVGALETVRTSRISDGTAEVFSSIRSLAAEFPASEFDDVNKFIRDANDNTVYVRGPKGDGMD